MPKAVIMCRQRLGVESGFCSSPVHEQPMKTAFSALIAALVALPCSLHAELPSEPGEVASFLEEKGLRLKKDADGHVVELRAGGKEGLTSEEYALVGHLESLKRIAVNGPPLGDGEWSFLEDLPDLRNLTIWHGKEFVSLANFSGLPVESLTVGGCMGLTRLAETEEGKRDAVLTLTDLPNLKTLSLYHSPLTPDDSHIRHIASEFPALEGLRLDFKAPRGQEINVTPEGLRALAALPLRTFRIENFQTFTPEHIESIAAIESLEKLVVDARRATVPEGLFDGFREARPDVEVELMLPKS